MMHPDAPQEMLAPSAMKLSELIGALSYALDITEGQPAGHCVRCCSRTSAAAAMPPAFASCT